MPLDTSKWLTTPIGAVIGLAVARKGIPKSMRGRPADILGLGVGAGAGYAGGNVVDDLINESKTRTPGGLASAYAGMSPEELVSVPQNPEVAKATKMFYGGGSGVDRGDTFGLNLLRRIQGPLGRIRVYTARAEMLKNLIPTLPPEKQGPYVQALQQLKSRISREKPNIGGDFLRGAMQQYSDVGKGIASYIVD